LPSHSLPGYFLRLQLFTGHNFPIFSPLGFSSLERRAGRQCWGVGAPHHLHYPLSLWPLLLAPPTSHPLASYALLTALSHPPAFPPSLFPIHPLRLSPPLPPFFFFLSLDWAKGFSYPPVPPLVFLLSTLRSSKICSAGARGSPPFPLILPNPLELPSGCSPEWWFLFLNGLPFPNVGDRPNFWHLNFPGPHRFFLRLQGYFLIVIIFRFF